ncbi:hypothetical protein HMI55_005828, partial [Coelomomyces lativittatus]
VPTSLLGQNQGSTACLNSFCCTLQANSGLVLNFELQDGFAVVKNGGDGSSEGAGSKADLGNAKNNG